MTRLAKKVSNLEFGQETAENFMAVMAGAVAQVSVVTTDGVGGKFGVTVSAFSSVSAEPPMVLVCVNERSPAVKAIEENGVFCVNLLNDDQQVFANCFAGRSCGMENFTFSENDWQTAVTGAPVLPGAVANFDCVLETSQQAGTHHIFIGRVSSALASEGSPLAFAKRGYQKLIPLDNA